MSDEGGWFVAWTECRVCPDGARHISVFPSEADSDALECPRCHHMTSEAVEYIPPEMPRHDSSGRINQERK